MQYCALVFLAVLMGMTLIPTQSIFAQASEDKTMHTMSADKMASPLKQMSMGVGVHDLKCQNGQQLVYKASNWRPACVNESSVQILQERGWAASVQPSDDALMTMQSDYIAMHPMIPQKQPTNGTGDVTIEEGVSIEGKTNTGGNETQSQNFTVNLSEAMEMGAQ